MTRRQILQSAAGLAVTTAAKSAAPKILKNMGTAGPGLGARIRATRAAGKEWDIVQYAHEKGLGGAHTRLPKDLDPAKIKKAARPNRRVRYAAYRWRSLAADRGRLAALRSRGQSGF